MRNLLLTLLLLPYLSPGRLAAQADYERIQFGQDAQADYYLAVPPPSDNIAGVLVLLPGFAQPPESIFPETDIPQLAAASDLLVIALAAGPKLYADAEVVARLDAALRDVITRYGVAATDFVLGGFSAGGTVGLRYAQYAYQYPAAAVIRPRAVFSVDSPVDLFAIYDYFEREQARNYSAVGLAEANFAKDIMLRELGDPTNHATTYDTLTPFNAKLLGPGNERFLCDTAVRVYHDVDVVWQLENRRRSLYDANALGASELIARLLLAGNDRAEFMQANGKGVRSNGQRHPHSWSIVDAGELVGWVLGSLGE